MPEPVQAPVDRADVRPGVDEHAGPGSGRHDERVPLPDVAGDRRRRRPAASPGPPAAAASRSRRDRPARPARAGAAGETASSAHAPASSRTRQQDRAAGAGRPAGGGVRHRRGALGDEHEPARRPAGAPDQDVPDGRDQRADDRRRQPEHGGRRDGGGGEQIGRQGDQADRSGEAGDERCRGQARGGAHREGIGQDGPASPARSHRDQPGATRTIAAVATTDRANPASRAARDPGATARRPPHPAPAVRRAVARRPVPAA